LMAKYDCRIKVITATQYSVFTLFKIELLADTKPDHIYDLINAITKNKQVIRYRVVETNNGNLAIEIPNHYRNPVYIKSVINSDAFKNSTALIPIAIGVGNTDESFICDLTKINHLLITGTSGSGKSVFIHSLLINLFYKFKPSELQLILCDPKMLELSIYEGVPHLLCPVITDMMEFANALNWCLSEIERRLFLMESIGVNNIIDFNKKVELSIAQGKPINDCTTQENRFLEAMSYIVIINEEFSDSMIIVGHRAEKLMVDVAKKGHFVGLYLILASSRPSTNVYTENLRKQISSRIAFQVSYESNSITILDQAGAEKLIGNGDMFFKTAENDVLQRILGTFVSYNEAHAVVNYLKERGSAEYIDDILSSEGVEPVAGIDGESSGNESDPLYDQAVAIVLETRRASISGIQRHLKVSYNRAARMVEDMEAAGLVTSVQSNGKCEVIYGE